jgi:hypothetical protein
MTPKSEQAKKNLAARTERIKLEYKSRVYLPTKTYKDYLAEADKETRDLVWVPHLSKQDFINLKSSNKMKRGDNQKHCNYY